MNITIASGKGGTGKTTFAVNLACALAESGKEVRLLDCDVEEPNDHLFIDPEFEIDEEVTVPKPVWDAGPCTACGKCAEACTYNAIAVIKSKVLIFNELCHSCGACTYVCPTDALTEQPSEIGRVKASGKGEFYFAQGMLNIGEALAPTVVQAVKKHMEIDAINILDAAPGTACPVVKALDDADVAVLVTEPTPFGLNDLKLAVSMTQKMDLPTGILINRSDGKDGIIADWARTIGVPVIGRIPFERKYAETYSGGNILVRHHPELRDKLLAIYSRICELKESQPPIEQEEDSALNTEPGQALTLVPARQSSTTPREGYRELVVISGKGGTGKTTVTASFAILAKSQVLADNDVDAADLHLLLKPRVLEKYPFSGGTTAVIDAAACIGCGKCNEVCHFNALTFDGPANDIVGKTWQVNSLACEGCGLCARVCPVQAIRDIETVNGMWYISQTNQGPLVHAKLGIAEENSGKLVTKVRETAAGLANKLGGEGVLADGPPGTGCPVIAAVSGADLVLIVTEPTVSGVHDMERVLKLAGHFGVSAMVAINKADLNDNQAARIEAIAKEKGAEIAARIPFDRSVNQALMEGKTVLEYKDSAAARAIRDAWNKVIAKMV